MELPRKHRTVGKWYEDFAQVDDTQVRELPSRHWATESR